MSNGLLSTGGLLPKQALYQAEPRPGPTVLRGLAGFPDPRNAAKRERRRNIETDCVAIQSQCAARAFPLPPPQRARCSTWARSRRPI
jgi:hypothetical protein